MSYPTIPIDSIVSGYKGAFDWLANATSRDIVVFTQPQKTGCQNHLGYDPVERRAFPVYNSGNPFSKTTNTVIPSYNINGILNIPFSGGLACPVCNGDGFIYSPGSGVAKARIQWRNKDTKFTLEDVKLKFPDFDLRIKVTGAADIALLDNAIRVVVDGMDCKIEKAKIPVGLRDIHTYYYFLNKVV